MPAGLAFFPNLRLNSRQRNHSRYNLLSGFVVRAAAAFPTRPVGGQAILFSRFDPRHAAIAPGVRQLIE